MRPAALAEFILTSAILAVLAYFYPETSPAILAKKKKGFMDIFSNPMKAMDPFNMTGMSGGESSGGSESAPAPQSQPAQQAPATALTPTQAPAGDSKKAGLSSGEATALTSPLGVSDEEQDAVLKKKQSLGA